MCASTAYLDSTSASECYGYAWQTLYVTCNDDFKKHCDMNISIGADFSLIDSKIATETLINMWNKLRKED